MNHTYKPPSLLPSAGRERTYALIIAGVPLLLILLTGVLPRLASDSGGSTGTTVDGQGGYSYQPASPPSATDPVTPDISTAYGATPEAPASGADATTGLSPDPVAPEATRSPADTEGTAGARDPARTVTDYFEAINNGDFRTAWGLGGKNLDSSYSSFVSGFDNTERDDVTVAPVDGTTVSVSLVATQNDGTQKSYSGRYTVVDGVITDASMTPTG
ncbi:hypothetical protein ACH41H_17695 [Streptomyces sp. NPDC020800]|uniref:hypothetical protein n=1 Tax=Streptomyces sp. NPDC020800 TaxID=3365092 RepID=UPI00378BE00C